MTSISYAQCVRGVLLKPTLARSTPFIAARTWRVGHAGRTVRQYSRGLAAASQSGKSFHPTEGPPPPGKSDGSYTTQLQTSPLQGVVFDERVISLDANGKQHQQQHQQQQNEGLSEVQQSKVSTQVASAMRKFVGFDEIKGERRALIEEKLQKKRDELHGTGAAAVKAATEHIHANQRWNVVSGAMGILKYLDMRSIQRVLLPYGRPRDAAGGESIAGIPTALSELYKQLGIDFSMVAPQLPFREGVDDRDIEKSIRTSVKLMNLPVQQVMVVSSDFDVLDVAKRVGTITCCARRDKPNNWKAAHLSLYEFKRLVDIQNIIEDLNGVSYRSSVLNDE